MPCAPLPMRQTTAPNPRHHHDERGSHAPLVPALTLVSALSSSSSSFPLAPARGRRRPRAPCPADCERCWVLARSTRVSVFRSSSCCVFECGVCVRGGRSIDRLVPTLFLTETDAIATTFLTHYFIHSIHSSHPQSTTYT
jgi:hypothetical protein